MCGHWAPAQDTPAATRPEPVAPAAHPPPTPLQEQYSEKADVWSLGCVLYHCMELRPPFDGGNPLAVAGKIVEGSYDPVRGYGPVRG
jgi:serine/threonine protein kinase